MKAKIRLSVQYEDVYSPQDVRYGTEDDNASAAVGRLIACAVDGAQLGRKLDALANAITKLADLDDGTDFSAEERKLATELLCAAEGYVDYWERVDGGRK